MIKGRGIRGGPRRSILLLAIISLSLLSLGFGPPKLTDSAAPKMPLYRGQFGLAIRNLPPPQQGTAELIMDYETGKVVFQRNAHNRIAPASTTKIMTAIVALEKGRLSDSVAITKKHMIEGSSMGLIPGDVVTLEGLLWGLLLPSGNDAALAIADYIGGGSVGNFVKMMNDKAAEMGLQNTHFVNPHGLDEDDHYSSAYDLAVMSRYALKNSTLNTMVGTNLFTVQASRTFHLQNANQLLRRKDTVPGVDGIKTGMTEKAGDSLVASATRNGRRVIVVAMGTVDRAYAATQLINYAFNSFVWLDLPAPFASHLYDSQGLQWQVTQTEKRGEMIFPWQKPFISYRVNLYQRHNPYTADSTIGTASYSLGGSKLADLPLRIAAPQ